MPEKLEDDDEISLLEGDTAKLRTSHMSFRSFADELVIYRSRLLLDRTPPQKKSYIYIYIDNKVILFIS